MKSTKNNPENSLPYYLRGAFRGFETALSRYLEAEGLPLSYFHILRLQWNEAGHAQSYIAKKAFMTESAASQIIKKMAADKILRRVKDPNDGRGRLVFLTEKGVELRENIVVPGIRISQANAPDISQEDMLITMSVLKKIREAFDVYNEAYWDEQK